jgi:Fe-S cluster biogenesis protein NfuA
MSADGPREGERIARLLEEIQATAGPGTWQKVEELVRRLVALYGDVLARVLTLSREARSLDPARLCEDELVSSLLLLHGLHPLPPAERVARAVAALRDRLAPDGALELVGLGDDGVVRLRLSGGVACGVAASAVTRGIEHAVLEAAPEVARVEIEGAAEPPPSRGERLVTLGRPRAAEVKSQ